jgi:3-oxoacyl-[acyl-carrier-protein] synthase II
MADGIELGAVERLLGNAAPGTPMSSTKSMTGHLLGAAGAIEAAMSNSFGFGGTNAAVSFEKYA